jgi:hypothetical protein
MASCRRGRDPFGDEFGNASPSEIHGTVASGSPSSTADVRITRLGEQQAHVGLLPHRPALYGA